MEHTDLSQDTPTEKFSTIQKEYLDGFLRGSAALQALGINGKPAGTPSNDGVEHLLAGEKAQLNWTRQGKRLSKEEQIKKDANPLDCWSQIVEHSQRDALPKDENIFKFKFHGLFNVSPAQESMMCRLRVPAGLLTDYQALEIARCARELGDGRVWLTTRANVQLRGLSGGAMSPLLSRLHACGIVPRGSGADNIRNITASATCGIDPNEILDTGPVSKALHHHILHSRELYGLPRKFNVAFDGGGVIGALMDTNDVGLKAIKLESPTTCQDGSVIESGIYFRLFLGGITGHGDLAKDTGVILSLDECIEVIHAILLVFIENGDRSNRKKARLKYLLDAWGLEKYIAEVEKKLGKKLSKYPAPETSMEVPSGENKWAHLGIHEQKQKGLYYIGVGIPVGELSADQFEGLASIARHYGSGCLRLTVWQNLLISDIPSEKVAQVKEAIEAFGFSTDANPILAGMVACTGAEGCKFGNAPTKSTAHQLMKYLQSHFTFDTPINIHITGCPHSCAQHAIADLGLLGASVETNGVVGYGFHVSVAGSWGTRGKMGVTVRRFVPLEQLHDVVSQIFNVYFHTRKSAESFSDFCMRQSNEELVRIFDHQMIAEVV